MRNMGIYKGRPRRVIVIGAHTDDGEFGCGATMNKLIGEGAELYYAMMSICEDSVPEGLQKDILQLEAAKSCGILGLKRENLLFYNFTVRKFPQYRQELLEEFVRLRKSIKPDLVILPSSTDLHQDHATVAAEGLRAFKTASILGYEFSWNNLTFSTHLFSVVTRRQLHKKILALNQFKSQDFRSYAKGELIKSLAEVRGSQISKPYAEAFEVVRWII